jgi:hypothetical protein
VKNLGDDFDPGFFYDHKKGTTETDEANTKMFDSLNN